MTQRPTARVDFEEEGLIPNLKKRTENQKSLSFFIVYGLKLLRASSFRPRSAVMPPRRPAPPVPA